MKKQLPPNLKKDLRITIINSKFWNNADHIMRKMLVSIDFEFEYTPNTPNEKKRIKNRNKRKRHK